MIWCVAGVAASYASCDTASQIPENAYFIEDLDKNGIPDLVVVLQDNYKIPLYGMTYDNKIIYLSAEEMKLRPDNVINYDNIERRLNKDE